MLPLDSPQWTTLNHAYGSAKDTPELLKQLREPSGWTKASREKLWSSLCHQGTTYSASYAAVPHLVALTAALPRKLRLECLHFVGAVVAVPDADAAPSALAASFEEAVAKAKELALHELRTSKEEERTSFIYLLQTVAALHRWPFYGSQLDQLVDGEFSADCPECGTALYVNVEKDGFSTSVEDPAVKKKAARLPVVAAEGAGGKRGPLAQLVTFCEQAGQVDVARLLRALTGKARCPKCQHTFDLLPALEAASG